MKGEESVVSAPKVLLIDDEPDFCEIFKQMFAKWNFTTLTLQSPEKGIETILKEDPDCLVLDVYFGAGEDGLTFLRRLRSYQNDSPEVETRVRSIPVVILSAQRQMKAIFEGEGICAYIEKPFDSTQLRDKLLQVIRETKRS